MKNFIRINLILVFIFCICAIIPNNISNADNQEQETGTWSSMFKNAEPSKATMTKVESGASSLAGVIKKLLGFLQVASGLITVLIVAFTGFNYILTTDAEVKSALKKKAMPIVIGFICVFAASSIASFLIGVAGA